MESLCIYGLKVTKLLLRHGALRMDASLMAPWALRRLTARSDIAHHHLAVGVVFIPVLESPRSLLLALHTTQDMLDGHVGSYR